MQDLKPRNIGPGGMSGRVTAIDVQRSNPDVMYAGTASGGLWKSSSGGIKWEPIFDKEVTASIGAIARVRGGVSVDIVHRLRFRFLSFDLGTLGANSWYALLPLLPLSLQAGSIDHLPMVHLTAAPRGG